MTNRRKPVAAVRCGALPRLDRIAASIALGAMALTGCKNPFEPASEQTETQQAGFDPTAGLASIFATTSIQTVAEPHASYPLLTLAAMQVASRVHAATTPPPPPTPPAPPTGTISTFTGGAMAIYSPRPVRGGVRSVRTHR